MTYGEIIVSGAIVVLVLIAAYWSGRAIPVGTGGLVRRIALLEGQVSDLDARLDRMDGLMGGLSDKLDAAANNTSAALAALRLEMAGDRGVSERTWSAVDRLQNYFMDQALEQAFGRDRG